MDDTTPYTERTPRTDGTDRFTVWNLADAHRLALLRLVSTRLAVVVNELIHSPHGNSAYLNASRAEADTLEQLQRTLSLPSSP